MICQFIQKNSKEDRALEQIEEYISESNSTVEKGAKFLEWILFNIFDKTESELDDEDIRSDSGVLMPDGCGDKGIDAAFIYKSSLHIIQRQIILLHLLAS